MTQAKNGDTVSVHYTGKLEDGTVFDTSEDRDPLTFTIGQNMMIKGFEDTVIGMKPGDSANTKILADDAYGHYVEEKIVEIERASLPSDFNPEKGQRYSMSTDSGEEVAVLVVDMTDASVFLDANHPLAGKDLYFEINLVEIA